MYYTPELTLDKLRIFVYTIEAMITRKALRKRAQIIRKRGLDSYQDCRFLTKTGDETLAAQCRGRYQAYYDAYHLIHALMNTTQKGGDT